MFLIYVWLNIFVIQIRRYFWTKHLTVSLEADKNNVCLLTGLVSFSGSPELKYLLTSSQLKVKNVEMLFYLASFFLKNIIFILVIVH